MATTNPAQSANASDFAASTQQSAQSDSKPAIAKAANPLAQSRPANWLKPLSPTTGWSRNAMAANTHVKYDLGRCSKSSARKPRVKKALGCPGSIHPVSLQVQTAVCNGRRAPRAPASLTPSLFTAVATTCVHARRHTSNAADCRNLRSAHDNSPVPCAIQHETVNPLQIEPNAKTLTSNRLRRRQVPGTRRARQTQVAYSGCSNDPRLGPTPHRTPSCMV